MLRCWHRLRKESCCREQHLRRTAHQKLRKPQRTPSLPCLRPLRLRPPNPPWPPEQTLRPWKRPRPEPLNLRPELLLLPHVLVPQAERRLVDPAVFLEDPIPERVAALILLADLVPRRECP